MTQFAGAVLTGGRSSRMGRDKALLEVDGRPLALVSASALVDAGAAEVVAVGGDARALAAIGLTVVPDRSPGDGPLAAVATALAALDHDVVVVLACDLPHVTAEAVRAVVDALDDDDDDDDIDVAIPVVDGRPEVLVAAYRRRCLPALEVALARGDRALRAVLPELHVRKVYFSDPGWAANANRPEDLAAG